MNKMKYDYQIDNLSVAIIMPMTGLKKEYYCYATKSIFSRLKKVIVK